MAPCDYEEADTRLLIHLHDALLNNCTNCLVRTVNTDVVVILIGKFHHLITICQDVNIWVSLVRARTLHIITSMLYLQRPWGDTTGCDTTSVFLEKGILKKSAWEAWNCYHDVTRAFTYMAPNPYTELKVEAQHFELLERFTVILYNKTSDMEHWMKPERSCVARRGRQWRLLSPTQDALLQHTKRVAYQAYISSIFYFHINANNR